MRPTNETIAAVDAWLTENNISSRVVSPASDWVEFSIPVSTASELFDAEFSIFQHSDGSRGVRTLQYSLPVDLKQHVDLLFPGVSFVAAYMTKLAANPRI